MQSGMISGMARTSIPPTEENYTKISEFLTLDMLIPKKLAA